jgi:hypothetical protein
LFLEIIQIKNRFQTLEFASTTVPTSLSVTPAAAVAPTPSVPINATLMSPLDENQISSPMHQPSIYAQQQEKSKYISAIIDQHIPFPRTCGATFTAAGLIPIVCALFLNTY